MAKRGGTTEVNGFISFAPDKKTGTPLKKAPSRRRGSVDHEDKKKELLKSKKHSRDESLEKHGTPKHRQEIRVQRKPESVHKTKENDKSKGIKKENLASTDKQKSRTPNETQKKSTKINEDKQQKLKAGKLTTKTTSSHQSSQKIRSRNEEAKPKSEHSMKTSKTVKPSASNRSNDSGPKKKISSMASSEEFEIASKRSIERIRKLTSSLEEKLALSPSKKNIGRTQVNQKELSKPNKREEIEPTRLKTEIRDATMKYVSEKEDSAPRNGMASSSGKSSSTAAIASMEESDSYEDDFESYESDFEECTESGVSGDQDLTTSSDDEEEEDDDSDTDLSLGNPNKPVVEEERKLDSGNYDLSTQKQQHQLNEIKDALLKENSTLTLTRNLSSKQEETILGKNESIHVNENIFINFANAKQRQIKQKINEKVQKRGACLMEMINLDTMMFSLLDMPSVPYDIFIKCYGKSNTQQMQTQTNDDCLSEEVQTEEIQVSNKWSQHPIKFHPIDSNPEMFLNRFIMDRKGVGDDGMNNDNDEEWQENLHVNFIRLQNFLSSVSEVILTLLEEEQSINKWNGKSVLSAESKAISDGFTALRFENVEFLKGRQITSLKFSLTTPNQMITVHKESELTPSSLREECLGRSMICLWNVYKHSSPQKILVSPGSVLSAQLQAHLVFAGLSDGSVCVWDLREKSAWHQRTGLHGLEHTLRSPTFITAKVLNDTSHGSPVVSVQCWSNRIKEETLEASTYQIASLELDGIIIIWTVIHLILSKYNGENMGHTSIPGLAPWGHVRLVPSVSINVLQYNNSRAVEGNLECNVLSVCDNHLFVGTNTGMITHCLKGNSKGQPSCYYSNKDETSEINCIEVSPGGDPLFLSASSTGKVNLFQRKIRNPMLELIGTVNDPGPPVKSICWSPVKQNIFFILDGNSSIHVWDLCYSDFTPRFSLPKLDSNITAMSISPHAEEPLLALSTDKGEIEIHRLNEAMSEDKSKRESEMFKHYLNIVCC